MQRPYGFIRGLVRSVGAFAIVGIAVVGSGAALALSLPQAAPATVGRAEIPVSLRSDYQKVNALVGTLLDRQHELGQTIVSEQTLKESLARIQLASSLGQFVVAKTEMSKLRDSLAQWDRSLTAATATPVPAAAGSAAGGHPFIPIVMYHYTPADFEAQLTYLEDHGYTTVDLDQAAAALDGKGALPPKPVVLTFDDGFADQMKAFDALRRHHMKATFYIINGGAASNWCVGSGRHYGDPAQPPGGCGDSYLSWDQVRQLDRSGIITIAAHTTDHLALAAQSPGVQRQQMVTSKTELERQVGHSIRHLAYPYGSYNDTTVQIAREVGFVTAVTTLPGSYQAPGELYALKRIRETTTLP